jgi:HD superfamily phosphodiesterase
MNIINSIYKTEKKYLPELEAFFLDKWGETKLWSHDLSHHKRVWNYAKEILLLYDDQADKLFVDKLLITCYLHDLGMSIDPGSKHGLSSKMLSAEFLIKNMMNMSDYPDILEAIENHDNKEYIDSPSHNKLLLLLSVADDMDAFGYIGIYRYIEIYLARGVQPDKIGPMILENAARRFKNLESVIGRFPGLLEKHRIRYLVLESFFKEFGSELESV